VWDSAVRCLRATPRPLVVVGGVLALGLLVAFVWLATRLPDPDRTQLLDPDRPARELALRDARAGAQLDYRQVWQDHSPCWQANHPEGQWLLDQEVPPVERERLPAHTTYSVVGVRSDGVYRRVEVRVVPPGLQQLDYEIDVRPYQGRWVVVDIGDLGHHIGDDCAGGHGS
jgi:hypothetical protein